MRYLSDYGPVDSFIPEDAIVGGLDDATIRLRAVIKFCHLLTRLGLQSPDAFLNTPMFSSHSRGKYNSFQRPDGGIGKTIYGR